MIKLEKIYNSYLTCHSCGETKDLIQISIGRNERQTIVIRLCKRCHNNLNKQLNFATLLNKAHNLG